MKKIFTTIIFISTIYTTYSQSEYSAYTSTGRAGVSTTFESDYHAIGINPANLGFHQKYENKSVTIGMFETAFSLYSEALTKDVLWGEVLGFKENNREFDFEDKLNESIAFADKDLAINFDIMHFGVSYFNENIGGFGFTMRDRVQWYSTFNGNFSKLLFLGYQDSYFDQLEIEYNNGEVSNIEDAQEFWASLSEEERLALIDTAKTIQGIASQPILFSQLFDGTRLSFSAYREYNLSYGKEFAVNDYVEIGMGMGLKYLQGYAIADINVEAGEPLNAYTSISPLISVDYGESSQETDIDTINGGTLLFPEPAGSGVGFDFGLNLVYDNKFKVGLAINNIGSINWTGNVFTVQDDTIFDIKSSGFDNYNVFDQTGNIEADNGTLDWKTNKSKKVALPTVFRGGASYIFYKDGSDKESNRSIAEIGFDIAIPFNQEAGNLSRPQVGLGGDYSPIKWIDLSTGISFGGNYGLNIPLGVDFIINEGTYEFGVATRDITYLLSNNSPNLSAAFGFFRFRF